MKFYRTIGAKLKGGEMAAILNISQGSYSDLYKAMVKAGAKYMSEGPGKGRRAFIVKEWLEA